MADVERDVTVLVKTVERPEALRRLVDSIRRFYPLIAVLVVDDSREPLDPLPEGITRYLHEPYNSLGSGPGRNFALRYAETEYVLFSDDDMVFGRRTDLGKMLRALEATRFDVVSCTWMDHDPSSGVALGPRRFEGTLDLVDRTLIHRFGATRGTVDDLPVFDIVHQFFLAQRDRFETRQRLTRFSGGQQFFPRPDLGLPQRAQMAIKRTKRMKVPMCLRHEAGMETTRPS
jgi:hypothetical protein